MISSKLQNLFSILEMEAFPRWEKANLTEKEKIVKILGTMQGKMIIKEIEEKSKIK